MTVAKRKIAKASETGRPDKSATFADKRSRKAARKRMWSPSALLKNVIEDAKLEARKRQEFYRKLRMIKDNRHRVAKAVRNVELAFREIGYELERAYDRLPKDVDSRPIEDAIALYNKAYPVIDEAANQHENFARQRIYYMKDVAA